MKEKKNSPEKKKPKKKSGFIFSLFGKPKKKVKKTPKKELEASKKPKKTEKKPTKKETKVEKEKKVLKKIRPEPKKEIKSAPKKVLEPKEKEEKTEPGSEKTEEKTKPNPEETAEKPTKDIVKEEIKKEIKTGALKIQTSVREIMYTQYKTVDSNLSINDILETMLEYSISLLPVVDKKGKIVGIIDQGDLIKLMETKKVFDTKDDELELQKIANLKASQLMKHPVTINEDENVVDAADKMAKEDLNSLFVVDKKRKIIGMIKETDAMRTIQSEFFMNRAGLDGKMVIRTGIDTLISLVKQKKSVKMKKVAAEMGISKDKVEEWAALLEGNNVIELTHPLIGDPVLRWIDEK